MFNRPLRYLLLCVGLTLAMTGLAADAKTPFPSRSSAGSAYRRPLATAPRPTASDSTAPLHSLSAGDSAMSRSAAATSLRSYRSDQDYRAQFRQQSLGSVPASGRFAQIPHESYNAWNDRRTNFYGGYGWSPPSYIYASRPSFGLWDAMWMWFMLDSIRDASHAAFFYNHAADPGYLEWRDEANRLAAENDDLKQKLAALDTDMASRQGQPQDPNYLPADTAPQVALAANQVVEDGTPPAAAGSGDGATTTVTSTPGAAPHGIPWSTIALVTIAGGAGYVGYRNLRPTQPRLSANSESPAMTFAHYVHHRLQGTTYQPALFRLGMRVGFDESPFILARGMISAQAPPGADIGQTAATAIGRLGQGPTALHRVYVDGGFFQLHLDDHGQPDECRWFSQLDEFTPTGTQDVEDGNSWPFWLDEQRGQIGWPAFETPDGKRFERAWAPSSSRIPPHQFTEERSENHGNRALDHHMMLYSRPTGLTTPAPAWEYALLDLVEEGQEAYIALYVGIDANPAALQLS